VTTAPTPTEPLTSEEQDAADALWAAVAAGTLYALLTQSDDRRRVLIERMIIRQERILRDLGEQLQDGVLTLAQWERQAQAQLGPLYLAATAATVGGFALLTLGAIQAYRTQVAQQFTYLRAFRQQIAAGAQLLNGSLLSRLTLYARAAYSVAQQVYRTMQQAMAKTQERRVLGIADHCPECPGLAARGWQPIGTLPVIGDTVCKVNCRCRFEYR
jgi:hypothetical protein